GGGGCNPGPPAARSNMGSSAAATPKSITPMQRTSWGSATVPAWQFTHGWTCRPRSEQPQQRKSPDLEEKKELVSGDQWTFTAYKFRKSFVLKRNKHARAGKYINP